jgi:peptide/nickel transport system substrate-binding protein
MNVDNPRAASLFRSSGALRRRVLLTGTMALCAPRIAQAGAAATLKFVPVADLNTVDPHVIGPDILGTYCCAVYDMLYGLDESFTPRRQMVEGETVEDDGKRWRLTLRPGLRFHDGEPVRAADVVASLRRWGSVDAFGITLMRATDALSVVSDRVVEFRLKKPFPRLISALAKFSVPGPWIIPEHQATLPVGKPLTDLIGSGPFRMKPDERILGSRVVFEKFAAYVPRADGTASFQAGPKVARFDRVEWNVVPDVATAADAIIKGEVDWWDSVSPDFVPLLRKQAGVKLTLNDLLGSDAGMVFNTLLPPFDNAAIRRAILPAISQSDFMTAVAGEDRTYWRDRVGVFSTGKPLSTDVGIDVLAGDVGASRAALKDAGYRGERVVMMQVADYATMGTLGEVAADLLHRIGLNVDAQVMDYATLMQRRNNKAPPGQGGWNVYCTWYPGINRFDPASNLVSRGDGTYSGWSNDPRLRELRAAWFDAPDLPAQQAVARDIQREMWNFVPFIPLGEYFTTSATRISLSPVSRGTPLFYNVSRI